MAPLRCVLHRPTLAQRDAAGGAIHTINGEQWLAAALDVEDRVNPGHRLQRHGGDVVGGFVLAGIRLDVGELEELATGMAPA